MRPDMQAEVKRCCWGARVQLHPKLMLDGISNLCLHYIVKLDLVESTAHSALQAAIAAVDAAQA